MRVNIELLDQTLCHIEAHPDEWNQLTYRCESGLCFAGWAAVLAGGRWASPGNVIDSRLVAEEGDKDEDIVLRENGLSVHVHDRARRVLGLDDVTADELFAAANTLGDIRRLVADLKSSVPGELPPSAGTDPSSARGVEPVRPTSAPLAGHSSTTDGVPPTSSVVGSAPPVTDPGPTTAGSGS